MSVKKSANRIQYMVPCKNQSCPVKQIILEDKTDFYRVLYNKWSVTGCGGLDKSCIPCIFLYRVVLVYAVEMLLHGQEPYNVQNTFVLYVVKISWQWRALLQPSESKQISCHF